MALGSFLGNYQLADEQHKLYFASILEVPGSLKNFLLSTCLQHIFLSFIALSSALSGWSLLFPLWKALFPLFLVIASSSSKPQLTYAWDIVSGPSSFHLAATVLSTAPQGWYSLCSTTIIEEANRHCVLFISVFSVPCSG